jgi:putative DNA primase/helicase
LEHKSNRKSADSKKNPESNSPEFPFTTLLKDTKKERHTKLKDVKYQNIIDDDIQAEFSSKLAEAEGINRATPHVEILDKLLNQIEPLDFKKQANPKGNDEFKLSNKHYLVLSTENVLKVASHNNWGLCKNHDFIYLYNGTYWNELDKEEFQKFLGEAAEKMGVTKFSARFFLFRQNLFKQFLSTAYLPTPANNANKVLVNLLNGTYEITPKVTQLRTFERSDFITYQLPFEYDPNAKAPIFQAFLDKVLPDIERQRVLAEYLGSVFIKHGSNTLKEEKALILYGGGANGKSVIFEVFTAMFGRSNVSNYSLQSLTEEKGFYRAKIANMLLNYASEINGKLETSLFKAMVSGEPVEACLKHGQPFSMSQYAKFIFNCNELPKDTEQTNAFFRRFLIIPFDVTIPEAEQDKNLHSKIIDNELSGVFNWVLDGLNRLLKQKRFSKCDAAQQAVEKYRVESDSVQMCLEEFNYIPSITQTQTLNFLYSEYKAFCSENGYRACSKANLHKRIKSIGYETNRKMEGWVVYIGKKNK